MRALWVALWLFPAVAAQGEPEALLPLPPPAPLAAPTSERPAPLPPPAPLSAPTLPGSAPQPAEPGAPADEGAPSAATAGSAKAAPGTEAGPKEASEEAEEAPSAPAPSESDFVKGELSNAGVDRLVVRRSRVIVGLGYDQIGRTQYGQVNPQLALRFGDLLLAVGVPLNIEVFSSAYPKNPAPGENHVIAFKHAGTLRKEDWDEVSEYARVLTYLTLGRKEDHLYVDVGQTHVSTLGHGTIMRRYDPNIDINTTRVSAQVDAYNDYAGFEAMTNDILLWNVVGLLGFVKPLSFLGGESTLARSVSLGATIALDRAAPNSILFQTEPGCPVPGACALARVPAIDDKNHLMANRRPLVIGGLDLEAKVVKTDWVDIKPYIDYSHFLSGSEDGRGGGGGLTLGVLGRFNAGVGVRHAFRVIAELRFLGAGYQSGYFDTFYEVDKVLIDGTGHAKAGSGRVPLTKWQATVGANLPAGDGRGAGLPSRTGYYFEASWGVRDKVGVTLALDGDSSGPAKNFLAHLELPVLGFLQLFASLHVRGFENFATVFRLDGHAVAFAGARLKVLPVLFLSGRAYRTFELDALQTQSGPLGTLQYASATGYSAGLEVGWEF
jgi:hypothetical protein